MDKECVKIFASYINAHKMISEDFKNKVFI